MGFERTNGSLYLVYSQLQIRMTGRMAEGIIPGKSCPKVLQQFSKLFTMIQDMTRSRPNSDRLMPALRS